MKKVLRTIALLGAIAIYVKCFFIESSIKGSGVLNWIWAIVTGLLLVINIGVLINSFTDNDKDSEEEYFVIGTAILALVASSLTLKIYFSSESINLIYLPIVTYLIYCGIINRYGLSLVYMFGTIMYFILNIGFGPWYSYVLFIILIIAHLIVYLSLLFLIVEDDKSNANIIGLFIAPTLLIYSYFLGQFTFVSEIQIFFLLTYLLIAIYVSIMNPITMLGVSQLCVVAVGLFLMLDWHSVYSVILLFASMLIAFVIVVKSIVMAKRLSFLEKKCIGIESNYNKLTKKYNELVADYNAISSRKMKPQDKGNNNGDTGKRIAIAVAKGIVSGVISVFLGGPDIPDIDWLD